MGSELIEAVRVSKSKSPSSPGKCFPPGFRFHPTDEELVLYYLKRKICRRSLKLDIIAEVDVYKWDPEELPGQSKLKTGDRQWFFFSPRDRKYPNGGRSSRATMNGYWKATGKDRTIKSNSSSVGIKKTLVYYLGRAPSGQRTDWVMHEYTMDEEELKRCRSAQEHYALNKIFKKSGPGPKNGEQYGAPYVEEEWPDDDCLDVEDLFVQKVNPVPVDGSRIVREEEDMMLSSDIIEFLNKIVDEPQILPPLPEILEKSQDFSMGYLLNDKVDDCGPKTHMGLSHEQYEVHPGSESQAFVVNEDFLEMDDLIGPQPVSDDLQFPDLDSLCDFDFAETGVFETQQFQQNSGLTSEVVNDHHELHDDFWGHNKIDGSFTSGQGFNRSSGVIIEENSEKPESCVNQCVDDGTDSWFSSALWAFVDSIPTTPASASESTTLMNRAFERMSSFSRSKSVNVAAAAAAAAAASSSVAARRLDKSLTSNRGIIYFSVLGVLFAILWVFVGRSIELLRGLV